MNRVNGCLHGTHNLWCTDRSVDFWLSLSVIRKLRHVLYCNVRVLLWHVLFHTSHTTLFGTHFMSYVSIGTNWPLLSWSIGSWISDYMCKQCQSPLTLWAWIPLMARCTRYNFPWYICFSELRQDDSLLRVLRFLQTIKLIDRI